MITTRNSMAFLLFGVILPILSYVVVTRWVPWTNHNLGLAFGFPQFIAQILALMLVMVASIFIIVSQWVRRGCNELALPVAPGIPFAWRAVGCVLIEVVAILAVLPGAVLAVEDVPGYDWAAYLPVVIGGILILSVLAYWIYGIVRRSWFRKTYSAYYGSLLQASVPAIALMVIALNIIALPYLRHEEGRLIAKDTLIHVDSKGPTKIETRLVLRLKTEMQQASARFPEIYPRTR